MPKKMLIDATHPEETRVVVVDGNKVEDFDFESVNKRQLAGNIYLAKVTRVEPSLQAAFVEYGGNRHGFLAFSEIHPDYYQIPVADREALLAEEAREEAAERAREEEDESRPRRSRGRSRRSEPKAKAGTASGLEVIDIDGPDLRDAPAGLEIADPDAGEAALPGAEDPRTAQEDTSSTGRKEAAEEAFEAAAFPGAVETTPPEQSPPTEAAPEEAAPGKLHRGKLRGQSRPRTRQAPGQGMSPRTSLRPAPMAPPMAPRSSRALRGTPRRTIRRRPGPSPRALASTRATG